MSNDCTNKMDQACLPKRCLRGAAWCESLQDLRLAVQDLDGDLLALHAVVAAQGSVHRDGPQIIPWVGRGKGECVDCIKFLCRVKER